MLARPPFEKRNIITNTDIMIQNKTGLCFRPSLCVYNTPGESYIEVACLLYHNSKGTCCTGARQSDGAGHWRQAN